MFELTSLYIATVVLAGLLATLAIWTPRALAPKVAALCLAVLMVPTAYAGLATLLSKPKPVALEWMKGRDLEATVLGAVIREGEGIYLWLQIDGNAEPRYYKLPWDQKLALQLQQAMRDADKKQNGLRMRDPYEPSWDRRKPKFYARPHPAPPPKEMPDGDAPMIYRHPGWDV